MSLRPFNLYRNVGSVLVILVRTSESKKGWGCKTANRLRQTRRKSYTYLRLVSETRFDECREHDIATKSVDQNNGITEKRFVVNLTVKDES